MMDRVPELPLALVLRLRKHEYFTGFVRANRCFYAGQLSLKRFLGSEGRVWVYPTQIRAHCRILGITDAETVVDEHTLYPLFRITLPREQQAAVRNHFLGEGRAGIAAICGSVGPGYGERCKICLKCIDEDESTGQLPKWVSAHQAPGIAFCARHAAPLYEPCGICRHSYSDGLFIGSPERRCGCGNELRRVRTAADARHEAMEIELAAAVATVLGGELHPDVDDECIKYSISKAAASLGVSASQLSGFMRTKVGDAMLSAYPMSLGVRGAAAATVNGRRAIRSAVEALLLGRALYGSYMSFFNSLNASQEAMPTWRLNRKRPKRQRRSEAEEIQQWESLDEENLTALHDRYSSQIESWIERNPDQGRKRGPCRSAQKLAYLFMRTFHPEWLNGLFPSRPRPPRNRSTEAQVLDKSMSNHIVKRKAELLAANVPRQIVHRHLVYGHSQASHGKGYWSQHPLTAKALSECVETTEQWRRRQLKQLHAATMETQFRWQLPPSDAQDLLPIAEVMKLIRKIQKWQLRSS